MALESSAEQPQPLGRVVQAVKGWVERCGPIWVEGQLIEIRRRQGASTHFLRLRDRFAEVSATLTCSTAVLDAAGPVLEGSTVTAYVRPTVWSQNGSLSFECAELRPSGEGRLLAEIERRKRLLQAEGLFDPARKKRLPVLPRAIGLVTGKDSAAERDVVTTIAARWPAARVITRHALVQGKDAAADVMAGIAELDANPAVQVIIVARGGGSLEDLLPFSDESLVRAVAGAQTPVVSAIGHEPDNPILDLVADLRALTPTDAGKRVVPDAREESDRVQQAIRRVRGAMERLVADEQRRLDDLRNRRVLREPAGSLTAHDDQIEQLRERLARAVDRVVDDEQRGLEHALTRVRTMSPKATLERGYAILADGTNQSVSSVFDVDPDDDVLAYLADGQLVLSVREIDPREPEESLTHHEMED